MPDYTSGGEFDSLGKGYISQHLTLTPKLMLSSKEKRRLRRTADKMEKRTTFEGRGMDVLPFYAKTDSQTGSQSLAPYHTVLQRLPHNKVLSSNVHGETVPAFLYITEAYDGMRFHSLQAY